MLSSVTISLLVLALSCAVVEAGYVNDFDQDARLECPANQIFSFIVASIATTTRTGDGSSGVSRQVEQQVAVIGQTTATLLTDRCSMPVPEMR
ncbi:hypothetical protein BsWGS_25698 [Bradybaena similaris]